MPNRYSREGDPLGHDWVPAECDVSIRPGWFWHASEVPKSAMTLLDIYYKSVGRNCLLLLNVPPNTFGLISDEDIRVLQEFSGIRRKIFSHNLAKSAHISASSIRGGSYNAKFGPHHVLEEGVYTYWAPNKDQSEWVLYLHFEKLVTFNVLQVQEPIQMGQRIKAFHVDVLNERGTWQNIINGTTVGYQRLLLFPKTESNRLRFEVDSSRGDPLIAYLGIYRDPFSESRSISDANFSSGNINGSQVLCKTTHNRSGVAFM